MSDIHVEAMHQAHDLAVQEANTKVKKMESEIEAIRQDARTLGIVQKINYDNAHNKLIKYSMLYQIRKSKEYKKDGITWEQYCEAAGENVRDVNRQLKDLKSFYENFQGKLSCFLDVPFNKIKYLGRSFQGNLSQNENGDLVLGEETIPLTPDNKEEIEAAIDTLIESHKQEKQALKKDLTRHKKQTDKIVDEETKSLKTERDALIREVDRLKPFDVAERDQSWSEDYMKEIHEITQALVIKCREFIMDDRIDEDDELKIRVGAYMGQAELSLQHLRQDWTDRFLME